MGKPTKHPFKDWETKNPSKNDFVRIPRDLLTSPAYVHLSPKAKIIYVVLKTEYKGVYTDNYRKPDTIICPYKHIKEMTLLSDYSISQGLLELELFGFIEINKGGILRTPNEYKFISNWKSLTGNEAKLLRQQHKKSSSRSEKSAFKK